MDKSKLLKEHQDAFDSVMKSPLIPQATKQMIYNKWLELKKYPKKDWNKPEVREKLDRVYKEEVSESVKNNFPKK